MQIAQQLQSTVCVLLLFGMCIFGEGFSNSAAIKSTPEQSYDRCPPGTYKRGTSNPCTPCPLGTFSSEWNATKCKLCQCKEDNHLQCNATSEECHCKTGYIYKNPEHSRCIPMENCRRGTELKRSGTITYTYTCKQCMNNTFSDTVGGTCKPWTDCQALGLITVTPGNLTHNAKCGCENDTRYQTITVVAALILFILSLILLSVSLLIWKAKYKNRKMTIIAEAGPDPLLKERCQLEDTCSCQISKEESGDKPVEDNSIKSHIIGA
ncbi:tumor necrosis factor receptor superfamily member 9-like [Acipenser oxyrinchus oxyrinchus]|uniref:Tumor necrosis factor receptor superfamily member 9-like n=1 Tax=Acipenser oxyrinchus oxyrinchus TaxID=40147 RepID=A0AAD8G076_ACIOX|nr:tumor necrosis factor receptor superfamily member 9-like [Acipenser oxyrinchus oxyrinchus]